MIQIVPSILSADFAHLADQIGLVERGGAQMLHVDIMDGHFVPNLTIGPPVVKSLRKATGLKLDVHLMITDPDKYAPLFIEAGADLVSVHYEAAVHLDRTLRMIRDKGARPGVVLNPGTPVSLLEDVLHLVDHVLIMSVNPGFEGQKFIPNALDKIRRLDRIRRERRLSFAIEIDGGVDLENVEEIVRYGCDWLVSGSSIFHSADPEATVKQMQQLAESAAAVKDSLLKRDGASDTRRCSFCHKSQDAVGKLISSPSGDAGAYICDECVAVCQSIVETEKV